MAKKHSQSIPKTTVLFVDDEPVMRENFKYHAGDDYAVLTAESVTEAISILSSNHKHIDILVTDYSMPGGHGGEIIWEAAQKYPLITRVLVSSCATKEVLIETINFGGVYKIIEKPLDRIKIQRMLEEATEYARQNREEQKIRVAADYDQMTGLFNRRCFDIELLEMIQDAQRRKVHAGLLLIDLDGFKRINDTFGHPAGDEVLIRFASTLSKLARKNEHCFRLGGDEFAVLVRDAGKDQLTGMADRIGEKTSSIQFEFDGHIEHVTASLGIAMFPQHATDSKELVGHADSAMYDAKNKGKNCWAIFQKKTPQTQ